MITLQIDLKVIYAPTISNRIKTPLNNPADVKVTLLHEGLHLREKIYTNNDIDLPGVEKYLGIYLVKFSSQFYPISSWDNKSLTNHNIRVLLARIKEYSPTHWNTLVNEWKNKFKKVGYDIW
ncbi:hypothetical protein [Leadbetterella sp. DM7]|uniref:hypothetical protein n=1 Tax=Leadbetterella sp. DM7 TaxID=3235085 RepID=UPI00349EB0E5